MSFVVLLPTELIEKIFSFLPIPDLVSVSSVSVSWYIASNSSRLWRAAIKQSSSSDRFIKLSDLDRFNGISSNYDSDHSFNYEKPSTSCLPPMNPWKLSVCQHNFVESNLRGKRPNLKLARHKIAFNNVINSVPRVTYPSNSAQDCLYLPVLGKKGLAQKLYQITRSCQNCRSKLSYKDILNQEVSLIRLDGVPRVIRLFTTEADIANICIDRHGIVWLEQNFKDGIRLGPTVVRYLPFDENFNIFQSRNLRSSLVEPDVHNLYVITPPCYYNALTMDANHLAVIVTCEQKQVKIWCRKTLNMKITLPVTTEVKYPSLGSFFSNSGHFYLAISQYDDVLYRASNRLEIYDVKQGKLISVLDIEFPIDCIVFGVKYYAIVLRKTPNKLICVRDIKSNKVMFNILVPEINYLGKLWFVDDDFLYLDDRDCLKVLNLVDWKVRDCLIPMSIKLDVIGSCLFVVGESGLDVWDWKLGRKLQEIAIPPLPSFPHFPPSSYFVNETRLVIPGEKNVEVVGFW